MGRNRKTKGGDFATFEKILSGKREELRKRIEQVRAGMSAERDPDDEGAAAVWNIEKELAMTTLDRDTRTLAEVEAALRGIDAGSYGTCVRCEERISDARLRAIPWTRLCLECAGGGVKSSASNGELFHPNVITSALQASLRARARAK